MSTRLTNLLLLLLITVAVPGCQAIADIFQAGIWVGVIIVLLIVGVVGFVMSRARRR